MAFVHLQSFTPLLTLTKYLYTSFHLLELLLHYPPAQVLKQSLVTQHGFILPSSYLQLQNFY